MCANGYLLVPFTSGFMELHWPNNNFCRKSIPGLVQSRGGPRTQVKRGPRLKRLNIHFYILFFQDSIQKAHSLIRQIYNLQASHNEQETTLQLDRTPNPKQILGMTPLTFSGQNSLECSAKTPLNTPLILHQINSCHMSRNKLVKALIKFNLDIKTITTQKLSLVAQIQSRQILQMHQQQMLPGSHCLICFRISPIADRLHS